MNKKTLNCILFLILSIIISSPAFAMSIDDIVGYWESKESKELKSVLAITPNSITQDYMGPFPIVTKIQDEKIMLITAMMRASVKIIDKNNIEMKIGHQRSKEYTRIDESTAKKLFLKHSKSK